MGQPTWRQARTLNVPEQGGLQWTLGLDFVTPGKLIKIQVEVNTTWTPEGFALPCGADGDSSGAIQRDNLMVPNAPIGALIGRIGGSTADQTADTNRNMLLFSVGR